MTVRSSGTQPILIEQDVVLARQTTRKLATECGMRLIDLTKLVTAVSELARNTMVYGGGGDMDWQILEENGRVGLRITFPSSAQVAGIGALVIAALLIDGFRSRA